MFKYSHALMISIEMDKFYQDLFGVLTQARRSSKAAALVQPATKEKEMITICKKEYEDLKDQKCANVIKQVVRKSMAASMAASGINPAQLIHNFITKGL
jgi:GTP1/Obg family GTP-binding protein